MTYYLRGIPPHAIQELWGFAEPYIKRALDHTFGELSAKDIKQYCMNEQMQLWMMAKDSRIVGVGTTQIIVYPQFKACRVITLAGNNFDDWVGLCYMQMKVWAKEQGCTAMEAYVRKGFVPKLAEIGFKHRYSVVHMDLE